MLIARGNIDGGVLRGRWPIDANFGKTRLVHAERHDEIEHAIAREKLVKKWRREWMFAPIEAENPEWRDLWNEWFYAESAQG